MVRMSSQSEVMGGVDTYILYGAETTYGTAVATTTQFGGLIQSASANFDRALQEWAGFAGTGTAAGRATVKYTTGIFSVQANVDFKVQRWDWLQYVMLAARTGVGTAADPFIYTLGTAAKSITVTENIDNVGTDSCRTMAGMVVDSCSIKCASGEPVGASVVLKGGKIVISTTVASKVANYSDDVYNFSGGSVEIPTATAIGNIIDSAELTISNNYELAHGLGNESAVNAKPKKLNIGLKLTLKYFDDDQMTRFAGSATVLAAQTPVNLQLKFTKGTSSITFAFADVVLSKIDDSHNLNEYVVEDVEHLAQKLTVTEVV